MRHTKPSSFMYNCYQNQAIPGNVFIEAPELTFENYASSPQSMRLRNNGKMATLDIGNCSGTLRVPTVSGGENEVRNNIPFLEYKMQFPQLSGILNGTYVFHRAYFHKPSEHIKSGKSINVNQGKGLDLGPFCS